MIGVVGLFVDMFIFGRCSQKWRDFLNGDCKKVNAIRTLALSLSVSVFLPSPPIPFRFVPFRWKGKQVGDIMAKAVRGPIRVGYRVESRWVFRCGIQKSPKLNTACNIHTIMCPIGNLAMCMLHAYLILDTKLYFDLLGPVWARNNRSRIVEKCAGF